MDIRELNQLTARQEMEHWWIRTRFQHLERGLARVAGDSVQAIEMGCGSGQNLHYLRKLSPSRSRLGRLVGIDPSLEPDKIDRSWLGKEDLLLPQLNAPQVHGSFDLLIAMDVLEHLDDDAGSLKQWVSNLRPGAIVFVTVPAFQSLWSHHDVVLAHRRRYTKKTLSDLARKVGLKLVDVSYAFGPMFLPVYVIRKMMSAPPGFSKAKSTGTDLRPTWGPLNWLLTTIGRLEAFAGGNPWAGTSVVGIFQKNGVTLE